MTSVKVRRLELIRILTANRKKHRQVFLEAQEGYREAVIAELDSMLADARAGKPIRRKVTLVEPMDQTADYDRVVRMLQMSVSATVDLSEHDFRQYVQDDWGWKGEFLVSNSRYLKSAKVGE